MKNSFTAYTSDKLVLIIDKLSQLNSKNTHNSHFQMGDRVDSHFTT